MTSRRDRVAIVGAGISGLAIAAALGRSHEVIVLEKGGIAGDTTSRASGVISLALEPVPREWTDFALEAFRSLDGRGIFSFTERETVRLVPAADGEHADRAPRGGVFRSTEELVERYPDSFDDLSAYAGGIVYDRTGYLDALAYAMTLKWRAERAGARIYRDHEVLGLRTVNGRVIGIETTYGPIDADSVVYATGWRARAQLGDHVELPVRPLRWNAIVVQPEKPVPGTFPMGSEPQARMYWRPTDRGDVLIGGNEHLIDAPDVTPATVDESFRTAVERDVAPVLRGVESGTVRRMDCCPTADTASPDGRPIVDAPADAPEGLVVVTGLHGRGVMLSPVVGRAVKTLLVGGNAPFPMEPFRLDRFEDRSANFEYVSHWA